MIEYFNNVEFCVRTKCKPYYYTRITSTHRENVLVLNFRSKYDEYWEVHHEVPVKVTFVI